MFKGYRTIIVNLLLTLVGLFGMTDVISPEMIEEFASALIIIAGFVNIVLRFLTDTKVGSSEPPRL